MKQTSKECIIRLILKQKRFKKKIDIDCQVTFAVKSNAPSKKRKNKLELQNADMSDI